MNYKRIIILAIFIFCIIISPVLATTYINSLPVTLSTQGETYLLNNDLVLNSGTAVTIGADNIVLDCQGKTINFAQTGNGIGVNINNRSNFEMKNCNLSPKYTNSDGGYVKSVFTGSTGASKLNIHDNVIGVIGRRVGTAYDREYGIHGKSLDAAIISNNTFNQSGIDRGTSVRWEGGPVNITNNKFNANGCTVTSSYPFFIRLTEGVKSQVIIDGNEFIVDSNSTNFYPINGWDVLAYVQIKNNKFVHSGTHGRVINPDNNSQGWLIKNNEIIFNGSGSGNLYGIRYRNANASGGNCGGKHIIENNVIDCSLYTGAGSCNAISLGGYADSTSPCADSHIRYNIIKARSGALAFYQGDPSGIPNLSNQYIYCNQISATSGSPIVIPGSSGELINIRLDNNELTPNTISTKSNWSGSVFLCGTVIPSVVGGGSVSISDTCSFGNTSCSDLAGINNDVVIEPTPEPEPIPDPIIPTIPTIKVTGCSVSSSYLTCTSEPKATSWRINASFIGTNGILVTSQVDGTLRINAGVMPVGTYTIQIRAYNETTVSEPYFIQVNKSRTGVISLING